MSVGPTLGDRRFDSYECCSNFDTGILELSRVRAQWRAPFGGHWNTGVVARQSSMASTLGWNIWTLAYWSCRASELSGKHPWVEYLDTGMLGLSRVKAQRLEPLRGIQIRTGFESQ